MTAIDTERALERFTTTLRRRKSRQRGWMAAAASVVVLGGAAGTYAVVVDEDVPPAITAARPIGNDAAWSTELPGAVAPREIAAIAGEVLVGGSGRIVRLDAASGEVRGVVAPAGDVSLGGPFAVTEAGVWTSYEDATRRGYARVDLQSGRVEAVADVGEPYFISAGDAGLWAVPSGEALVELEPSSGEVLRRVELPFRPYGLWVGDDEVWAQAAAGGALARVDVGTSEITAGPVLGTSAPAATTDEALWVADPVNARIVAVDLDSGQIRFRIPLLDEPADAAAGVGVVDTFVASAGDDVYVTTVAADGSRLLTRVDARDGTVIDVLELGDGSTPTAVAADAAGVYTASFAESRVQALAPPRRTSR